MDTLRKNDEIALEITGFTSEGSGIGRHNGLAVFVSGAAPGDIVKVVIIKAKSNYAVGKLLTVLRRSEDRVEPDCPVFPKCGGCVFRHVSYEAELRYKQQRVEDAFSRIGHLNITVSPIVGGEPDGYRNKAQFPVQLAGGRLFTGFYAPFSHRVIHCPDCRLQPKEFASILRTVARWAEKYKIPVYDETSGKGLLRHIYLRKGFATGQIMVCLVINGEKVFKAKELTDALLKLGCGVETVLLNHNTEDTNVVLGKTNTVLYGDGTIEDVLLGKRFRVSPLSFYQVNHDGAERLYAKAHEFAKTGAHDVVLDLYCGAGTIGLTMADDVKTLIGVEIVPEAVEDAKTNAELNGITNARFMCADAAKAAETLKSEGVTPDAVIVDPPRKGCDEALLRTVANMGPERIVYVSCDPATLARDCAVLDRLGYRVKEVCPFDMFPRTAHVECVTLMTRN
ncbi:MAG: 23S rRNA (uracil(1939)-C(5))-methyltransferase RlmD [Clostridia bacterium]|nr:23S rRNA (uracil(1939)-C(5))-methyltransferase RlmD [Clostridia bacterium]